ncbi:hypothetical protein [Ligilactobacillus aviarius]
MKYDYRQIIKIPYHQSQAHPRMPMAEQWPNVPQSFCHSLL